MVSFALRTATFWVCGAVWLASAIVLCGCGGPPVLPTGTVSGQVTHHDGKPLTNAEISFLAPQLGSSASAPVDANGRYTIDKPLKVGAYQVVVAPPETPYTPGDAPATKPRAEIENPDIPARFRNAATSGLTVEVKEGQNANVNFDLKD